jgi:hypothetical protein
MIHTMKIEGHGNHRPSSARIILHSQKELNEEHDFAASAGWLNCWKRWYRVRQVSLYGKELSSQWESFLKFQDEFQSLIVEDWLSYGQIYDCD